MPWSRLQEKNMHETTTLIFLKKHVSITTSVTDQSYAYIVLLDSWLSKKNNEQVWEETAGN